MPFHIQYTGPAPVSTYFRVKPAPEPSYGELQLDIASPTPLPDKQPAIEGTDTLDSQATLNADQLAITRLASSSSTATLAVDDEMLHVDEKREESSSGKHFVAAFRGRTVRGTKLDLPEGFTGIVLSTPDEASSKPPTTTPSADNGKRKMRARRAPSSARAAKEIISVDDVEEETTDGIEQSSGPVKVLEASGTFSSFMLWNADIPADVGRDEYIRSLSEWTKIAAEVSFSMDAVAAIGLRMA
jgi:hypothetical protein